MTNSYSQNLPAAERDAAQALELSKMWQEHAATLDKREKDIEADKQRTKLQLEKLNAQFSQKREEAALLRANLNNVTVENNHIKNEMANAQSKISRLSTHNNDLGAEPEVRPGVITSKECKNLWRGIL